MKPIDVLLIDDQLGAQPDLAQDAFARCREMIELVDQTAPAGTHDQATQAMVRVHICSGQRIASGERINDPDVGMEAVDRHREGPAGWGLVLLDVRFDSGPLDAFGLPTGRPGDATFGVMLFRLLGQRFPDLPLAYLTSHAQHEFADEAAPYLAKSSITEPAFRLTLLRHGRLSGEQRAALLDLRDEIVAAPATQRAYLNAFAVAPLDLPVLLTGETGTGKEVLARYIHRMSNRGEGSFVAVNVAAVPKDLFEATFFGHERGAFTGALEARPGLFEQAHGGTLFLDEVGELPEDMQTKLLRVLQEKCVRRLGGRTDTAVDVRLISATNRLVGDAGVAGMREDFLQRIGTCRIHLDPLRQRGEDVEPLAQQALAVALKETGRSGVRFSRRANDALRRHPLPGNVREVVNRIRSAVATVGDGQLIGPEHLGLPDQAAERNDSLSGASASFHAVGHGDDRTSFRPGVTADDSHANFALTLLRSLSTWLEAVPRISIPADETVLRGQCSEVENAVSVLMKRLAGAALQRTRNPVTGKVSVQAAMQLLYDEPRLSGSAPRRRLNALIGRPQRAALSSQECEELIAQWQASEQMARGETR